jgi:hypothetical protein
MAPHTAVPLTTPPTPMPTSPIPTHLNSKCNTRERSFANVIHEKDNLEQERTTHKRSLHLYWLGHLAANSDSRNGSCTSWHIRILAGTHMYWQLSHLPFHLLAQATQHSSLTLTTTTPTWLKPPDQLILAPAFSTSINPKTSLLYYL